VGRAAGAFIGYREALVRVAEAPRQVIKACGKIVERGITKVGYDRDRDVA
jgi:hypothetical protein